MANWATNVLVYCNCKNSKCHSERPFCLLTWKQVNVVERGFDMISNGWRLATSLKMYSFSPSHEYSLRRVLPMKNSLQSQCLFSPNMWHDERNVHPRVRKQMALFIYTRISLIDPSSPLSSPFFINPPPPPSSGLFNKKHLFRPHSLIIPLIVTIWTVALNNH